MLTFVCMSVFNSRLSRLRESSLSYSSFFECFGLCFPVERLVLPCPTCMIPRWGFIRFCIYSSIILVSRMFFSYRVWKSRIRWEIYLLKILFSTLAVISVKQMSLICGDVLCHVTMPRYLMFTPYTWKTYSRLVLSIGITIKLSSKSTSYGIIVRLKNLDASFNSTTLFYSSSSTLLSESFSRLRPSGPVLRSCGVRAFNGSIFLASLFKGLSYVHTNSGRSTRSGWGRRSVRSTSYGKISAVLRMYLGTSLYSSSPKWWSNHFLVVGESMPLLLSPSWD
jgi:hypothetical protein